MSDFAHELRAKMSETVNAARVITARAEKAGRPLTNDERTSVEKHIESASSLKQILDDANGGAIEKALSTLGGGAGSKGSLYDAFRMAGWEPGRKTYVPAETAFKDAQFDGDLDTLNPTRTEGAALGMDTRRLYTAFSATGVAAGVTSVQVVRQMSRTLPDPFGEGSDGTGVIRPIASTATKPEVVSVRELSDLAMQQVAVLETGTPNIILLQDGVRNMVNVDLRLAAEAALDALVVDAIQDASPDLATSGSDMTEAIVRASVDMTGNGYDGKVVAMSPSDVADLSLLRGADEVFARGDVLAGYRIIAVPALAPGEAYLFDMGAVGRLFISAFSLATFEENDGSTNSSTVRYEGNAALSLDRADAVLTLNVSS